MEEVILVNKEDRVIGRMEKLAAHEEGILHRAFSVFLFNANGEMLLQRRALSKYHSPGQWSNACCSHPRPGEETDQAARRRLFEELRVVCDVQEQYTFIYKAEVGNKLIEHELDHVFFGEYSGELSPNADEVEETKYVNIDWLIEDVDENPDQYTPWFRICLDEVINRSKAVTS